MIHQSRFLDWLWVMPATLGIALFCGLMLWVSVLPKNRHKSGELVPFFRTALTVAVLLFVTEAGLLLLGLVNGPVANILSVFGVHIFVASSLLVLLGGTAAAAAAVVATRARTPSAIAGLSIVLVVVTVLGGMLVSFAVDAGAAIAAGPAKVTAPATGKSTQRCGKSSTCYEVVIGTVRLGVPRTAFQQVHTGACYEAIFYQGPIWSKDKTSHILSIRGLPASSC